MKQERRGVVGDGQGDTRSRIGLCRGRATNSTNHSDLLEHVIEPCQSGEGMPIEYASSFFEL